MSTEVPPQGGNVIKVDFRGEGKGRSRRMVERPVPSEPFYLLDVGQSRELYVATPEKIEPRRRLDRSIVGEVTDLFDKLYKEVKTAQEAGVIEYLELMPTNPEVCPQVYAVLISRDPNNPTHTEININHRFLSKKDTTVVTIGPTSHPDQYEGNNSPSYTEIVGREQLDISPVIITSEDEAHSLLDYEEGRLHLIRQERMKVNGTNRPLSGTERRRLLNLLADLVPYSE